MKYLVQIILPLALLLLIPSCVHNHDHGDGHDHGSHGDHGDHGGHDDHADDDDHDDHVEGEIHLTQDQVNTMKITFGDFSQIKINDFVSTTGTLGLPPNALTSVSAKSTGFIKNSNKYVEGSYVKKGVVMAYLENPEFIQHQREYLEVSAELTFLFQELDRQKALLAANAGVEKNLQKVQSEVQFKNATLKGLAKELTYLGINVEQLTPENIVEQVAIISPMSGYITSIKMHNGMFVEPRLELLEIVNENHLHLELDVFEKDIGKIKGEQRISYTVPALGNTVYEGEVHIIGKEFNTENKTVRIHGHLEKERPPFIKDLFVDAKIWLNDQTVPALPEGALVRDGSATYLFLVQEPTTGEELVFEKMVVLPGVTSKGFTAVELLEKIPEGKKIVTSGAYYVQAQSIVGELEHSH